MVDVNDFNGVPTMAFKKLFKEIRRHRIGEVAKLPQTTNEGCQKLRIGNKLEVQELAPWTTAQGFIIP